MEILAARVDVNSHMDQLDRLCAIEEIRLLKARRLRALDAKDWDTYASLHTDDHVSDSYGGNVMRGNAENVRHLSALLDGIDTIHQVHSHEIVFDGASAASGIWSMEDRLFWTQNGETHWIHGWGHYHERYRRDQGVWRFCYRRLDRLRILTSPGGDPRLRNGADGSGSTDLS